MADVTPADAARLLAEPLDLPCGARLKNRLMKSAMSDSLGDGAGNPTEPQMRLYERWAQGGAALSVIGEVQTSPHYPEKPGNLILDPAADPEALRKLAERGSANGTLIWPQLGHAGALAHAPISQPKGPSPLDVDGLKCDGLSLGEIQSLPAAYARSAGLAQQAGFGGVLIHAGHGFLFSQFLSGLFNHRSDAYGGTVEKRFRIIGEVIEAIRATVGPAFPVGIRINATDGLQGGLTPDESLMVVRLLDDTSVDLIDVSGGTYFPGAPSSSEGKSADGPYFTDFGKRAKQATAIPIAVTGGFRTRAQAAQALRDGAADAIGLARAMVLDPGLPDKWLTPTGGEPDFPVFAPPPPGGITAWYSMRLTALGEDGEAGFDMGLPQALAAYETRDNARCALWRKRSG